MRVLVSLDDFRHFLREKIVTESIICSQFRNRCIVGKMAVKFVYVKYRETFE